MPLTKEDGSGKPDANSYADLTDAATYFDGHLYASAWTAATSDNQEKALIFATRLIDAQFQFNGFRSFDIQALQWPRQGCLDPDRAILPRSIILSLRSDFLEDNVVPQPVIDAACEMAKELLLADRTADPAGEGIDIITTGAGVYYSSTKYDKKDTRPILSHLTQALLSKFGSSISARTTQVKLTRT